MLHARPLDWEVVESHAVAPVQVLFKDDGVEIHQIAPNAVSGSYTFDIHSPCRTSLPASPPPTSTAAQAAQRPRPLSDPGTDTTGSAGTTSYSPKKLHRKSRSTTACPGGARGASNPFTFGALRRSPPAIAASQEEPAAVGAPEPRPERRRSLGTAFSFLQPRHGRDRVASPSSPSSPASTQSGASTSGSDDGAAAECGARGGPAAQKEVRARADAAPVPTRHSAGSYFPSVRPAPAAVPHHAPTPAAPPTPVPRAPSPPLAPPRYDKAQTKKVLKHARAELMKEVGKAGYNVLVVEGWELTVLRQSERYRIKVVYHARPAVAQSDLVGGDGMRVPRRPPYLSVLDD